MLFVSISFAFGSKHKRSFQWNMGLRIDKGYQRGALYLARRFITMIDVIVCYSYSERVYFSLFNDL